MEVAQLHSWEVSAREAAGIQEKLRKKINLKSSPHRLNTIAGIDVAYKKDMAIAGIICFSCPQLKPVDKTLALSPVSFPYIPGLLSFREAPSVIEAFKKIKRKPDLLLFDGQGIAHPRRMGLATHMGIYLNIPSVGCAKSKLVGEHSPLRNQRGAHQPVYDEGEMVGFALRAKKNTRPIYVSPGNLVNFESALRIVLTLHRGYKIPEPLRAAHILVSKHKKVV